MMFVVF